MNKIKSFGLFFPLSIEVAKDRSINMEVTIKLPVIFRYNMQLKRFSVNSEWLMFSIKPRWNIKNTVPNALIDKNLL